MKSFESLQNLPSSFGTSKVMLKTLVPTLRILKVKIQPLYLYYYDLIIIYMYKNKVILPLVRLIHEAGL